MSDCIRTRILIISDTHTAPLSEDGPNKPIAPFKHPLPKADLLIHCGDLTMSGKIHEYHTTVNMLKEIDAPVKLVIAGNHDLSLDRDFVFSHTDQNDNLAVEKAHDQVHEAKYLWTDPDGRAQKEGVTYLTEGTHEITLPNGAHVTIYSSPYTPEFCDWGFPYKRREDRFNPPLNGLSDADNIADHPVPSFSSVARPIDILLTHGPPYSRLDRTQGGDLAGCPHLLRAVMRSRPLLHCFGHIHEGWGAERVTWSSNADHVTANACSISEWRRGAWKSGVAQNGKGIVSVEADIDVAREQHGVFLDTSAAGNEVKRGEQTLLVNAAIMNVRYKPVNSPWVVDLDLPKVA